VHLHRGRVERKRFDLDADDLLQLQLLEDPVEHPVLGPAVHPHIDGVPVAEPARQATPFAALLGHIQDRIEHFQVAQTHIPALQRQTILDLLVLLPRQFHSQLLYPTYMSLV
jgi:hypothetical protein